MNNLDQLDMYIEVNIASHADFGCADNLNSGRCTVEYIYSGDKLSVQHRLQNIVCTGVQS